MFHNNNICTCSRHSNDHPKKYYRHFTYFFVRNSVQWRSRLLLPQQFWSCDVSWPCGGYLYANILANSIARLNNRIQWWCLGEKRTRKQMIYTLFFIKYKCCNITTVGLAGLNYEIIRLKRRNDYINMYISFNFSLLRMIL